MMKNEDNQVVARNIAAMILKNPKASLAETIQGIASYINDQSQYPAAASFMEDVLQNLCEALEPEQVIL